MARYETICSKCGKEHLINNESAYDHAFFPKEEIEDRVVLAIMRNIANEFDARGHFLSGLARAVCKADEDNLRILMPALKQLCEKYNLEGSQRERGILQEAQYM